MSLSLLIAKHSFVACELLRSHTSIEKVTWELTSWLNEAAYLMLILSWNLDSLVSFCLSFTEPQRSLHDGVILFLLRVLYPKKEQKDLDLYISLTTMQ